MFIWSEYQQTALNAFKLTPSRCEKRPDLVEINGRGIDQRKSSMFSQNTRTSIMRGTYTPPMLLLTAGRRPFRLHQ